MNTPGTDPVHDFFTAPDEVRRPVYERALEKAQEEQEKQTTPDTELHMKALAKSECAKDAGELTVVRLGYVVSLMKEVQDERDTYWKERVRKETERRLKEVEQAYEIGYKDGQHSE